MILAFALAMGAGWALLTFVGGDWTLGRLAIWSAGLVPLSAILHRLFRLDRNSNQISARLRELGAAICGAVVVLPITFLLDLQHPLMGLSAFLGTMLAYMLCHLMLERSSAK
jgi:peptidoglycan/LPS O-acetylase OafA/YrhL